MHTSPRPLLAAFAVAALASAAAVGVLTEAPGAAMASKCLPGEVEAEFTGVCVPVVPTNAVEMTIPPFGAEPEVDGVPCTGGNSYECIGLAEESQAAGPTATPHATVSSAAPTSSSSSTATSSSTSPSP